MKRHADLKKMAKSESRERIASGPGEDVNEDTECAPLIPPSSNEDLSQGSGIGDLFLLPKTFWLICLICVLLYGTVVPFNNIASDFLMSKWYPGDTQTAGAVMR